MGMPWIEASLRGQKVLARARSDGTLDVAGGRVEISAGPGSAETVARHESDVCALEHVARHPRRIRLARRAQPPCGS